MMRVLFGLVAGLMSVAAAASAANGDFDQRARHLLEDPKFKAAIAAFEADFDRFVQEIVTLTEIPAPTFSEKARAETYVRMLRDSGLESPALDEVGNALGVFRGRGSAPLLAVAAHLDTVFPAGTDVKVQRTGTVLRAPGVADDVRGLAFILAAIRAMRAAGIQPAGDILFIGDVGEEGLGDLRGIRHIFTRGSWMDRIKRFIAIDGRSNDVITNSALGSRRYRVTFTGPGGHSWGSFGQVSPAFAMGNAITRLGKLEVPKNPKVSYNVGVLSGGTSVNSIPYSVSMEVDLRSISPTELDRLDRQFHEIVRAAIEEENQARQTTFGRIAAEVKRVGDRPSGVTPTESPILRQVAATMACYDKVPVWEVSSTDANIPISLGIPGFAMASQSGDRSGRAHSLDEWTDVEKSTAVKDFSLALAILLTVADLP